MKEKILKILLCALIAINVASPLFHYSVWGFNDLLEVLSALYESGVVVLLSAAVIYLLNKNKDK